MRAAVDTIPPVHRERRPGPDRWSVAEVLEHLAIVERRIAGRLADALTAAAFAKASASQGQEGNGAATSPSGSVIDQTQIAKYSDRSQRFKTSEASEPKGGITADEAWTMLEAARTEVAKAVRESDAYPFSEPIAPHPRFGPYTFRQWVAFLGGHEARHADQIREMLPAFQAPSVSTSALRTIGRTPIVRLSKVVPPSKENWMPPVPVRPRTPTPV